MNRALGLMLCLSFATPALSAETAAAGQTTLMQKKGVWPAERLPADLPPYSDGEVAGSGGKDECVIQVANTSNEAFQKYLERLKAGGWDISSGESDGLARKGAHAAEFNFFGQSVLQISVRALKMSSWPAEKIPDAIPQPKDCKVMDASLDDQGGGVWIYAFSCLNMGEQEAFAYMDGLIKSGWSGDRSAVTHKAKWRGKSYGLSVELYELAGGNAGFSLAFQQEE